MMIPPDDLESFSREAEELRLQQAFKDFLIIPEIGGSKHSYESNRRIPAEKTTDSGKIVEIAKDDKPDTPHADHNTILVHRNADNEITHIEIVCTCGRKTLIRLEGDNDSFAHDPHLSVTDFEGKQASPLPSDTETEQNPRP